MNKARAAVPAATSNGAAESQASCVVFLGGHRRMELADAIRAGHHPDVEYLRFLRQQPGTHLISFDDVTTARSRSVRVIARHVNSYWAMAVWARLMERRRWSCVLATGEDVGLPLALVQRLTGGGGAPIAMVTHGSYLRSRKAARAFQVIRGLPGLRFLCLSETLRQRLIKDHRVPADQVVNVGYGVDTDFFRLEAVVADDARVRSRQVAAAGMANRDYKTLVAAVATLTECSVKIAADSAWFKDAPDIVNQPLPANVEVRSYGDYVGLRRLYAESACVVVPLYEATHACGYAVIAEAMAMSKPVITTRIQAHSDFIVDGKTGFYVPPGDQAALRERIAYLLSHPETARAMGRAARKRIEEYYSLDAYNARVARALGITPPPIMPPARTELPGD